MRLCPLRPLAKEKWVLGNPRNMGPLSRGTLKPALARSSMGARSPILQATCLWQSRPASPGGRQRPHPHFPEEQTEKGGQSPDCHSWGVGGTQDSLPGLSVPDQSIFHSTAATSLRPTLNRFLSLPARLSRYASPPVGLLDPLLVPEARFPQQTRPSFSRSDPLVLQPCIK